MEVCEILFVVCLTWEMWEVPEKSVPGSAFHLNLALIRNKLILFTNQNCLLIMPHVCFIQVKFVNQVAKFLLCTTYVPSLLSRAKPIKDIAQAF